MTSYFSRSSYDCGYSKQRDQQITKIGKYRVNTNQTRNNNICHSLNGPRTDRLGNSGDYFCSLGHRTGIESALTNRGRPDCRKCNITMDQKNNIVNKIGNCAPANTCSTFLDQQHTRLDHPLDSYRGLSTLNLQMDFPLIDPCNWAFGGNNTCNATPDKIENMRDGCNTRLNARDAYSSRVFGTTN